MLPQDLIDMLNGLIRNYNKNAQSWKGGYCTDIFRDIANYCGNVKVYQQYKKGMQEYLTNGILERYTYMEKHSYPSQIPAIWTVVRNSMRNIRSKL